MFSGHTRPPQELQNVLPGTKELPQCRQKRTEYLGVSLFSGPGDKEESTITASPSPGVDMASAAGEIGATGSFLGKAFGSGAAALLAPAGILTCGIIAVRFGSPFLFSGILFKQRVMMVVTNGVRIKLNK